MPWRTLSKLSVLAGGAVALAAPVLLAGVAAADDAPAAVSTVSLSRPLELEPAPTPLGSVAIKVSVHVKGGTLQLSSDTVVVTLHETSPGHLVGRYEGVRVLDARGTMPGWQLIADAQTPVRIAPDPVVPVQGSEEGLLTGTVAAPGSERALLGGAAPGHGAGVYELSGRVELDLEDSATAQETVVSLALHLR
jgi:hypothetical protein